MRANEAGTRTPEPAPPSSRRGRPPGREGIVRGVRIGGHDPRELAERFGTPLFAYDLGVVSRRIAALQEALPSSVTVSYAVTANPLPRVVRHVLGKVGAATVASVGELAIATRAGAPPASVTLTGPGKQDQDIETALDAGAVLSVESASELARVELVAARRRCIARVLLRTAAEEHVRLSRVRLAGDNGAGKFGLDWSDLVACARYAVRSRHMRFLGIHTHGLSNVLDARLLATHMSDSVDRGIELASLVGHKLELINLGGGMGIPYDSQDEPIDLAFLGLGLTRLAHRLSCRPTTSDTRLVVESGRFIVGQSGAYLTKVIDRKVVSGSHVVILDGGVNHILRSVLTGQEHRMRVLTGAGSANAIAAQRFPVTVAGPLSSGLDILADAAVMAVPDIGDLVAVLDVGAYGFTQSMPFFSSYPIPPEVVIDGDKVTLARARIDPQAWLAAYAEDEPADEPAAQLADEQPAGEPPAARALTSDLRDAISTASASGRVSLRSSTEG
jgi:diaminopimelate decarboxylase